MTTPITASGLVYNRIEQNRRKTVMLVIVAILLTIPFVFGSSFAVAEGITWQVSRQSHLNRFHRLRMDRLQTEYDDIAHHRESPRHLRSTMDTGLRADIRTASEYTEGEKSMRIEILLLFATGLAAVLGLLVWGFASSPTSKLLAMCNARPAGNEEREAQRILENLAIGAGLPAPRLYVIESMSLNAFAAGMTPRSAVIAVTHGLLAVLDSRELEGVLAHELSHIGNCDTRLNVMAASFALFLRMPYLMLRKYRLSRRTADFNPFYGRLQVGYSLLLIPVYIYVFLVAPLLAALVRSAISRSREFLADADAALLTRYPEGLMRALAKIAEAGSAVAASNPAVSHLYFADPDLPGASLSFFSGNLLATHPPIDQRISRLVEFGGPASAAAGRDFTRDHPALPRSEGSTASSGDELALVTSGNPLGRVFRVVSDDTPIYDRASTTSMVLTRVRRDDLLVVFDDPGKMRQVMTSNETVGYIPLAVKLQREDMLPAEIHDRSSRSVLPDPEPEAPPQTQAALPATASATGLTMQQIGLCAGFGILVFAAMLIALVEFGGK